ncbi:hypothetical protein GGR56DRAFT_194771 [Xylariaceae sp. FL0804]|nr:hypothetical protein GGR56DRAFT_194771 [Xylariaceae sp. FL0804]
MNKSVCIIGAGPSGIVAAKTLLHDVCPASFRVTVYDAQPRIGGLWPASKDDGAGLVHPLMVANQSKHTVQFSDLAWQASDPEFPRAWQVGQYLERYTKEYPGADIRLGHRVVAAEPLDSGSWTVQTESEKGTETNVFDYLLVATGYFGEPVWPGYLPREGDVPIIHSSKYRDVESLVSKHSSTGDKILIVGGQMSGIETAGTIATHLSSAKNSPGEKGTLDMEKYSIHHVAQRPSWVFPLFTSPKADTPAPPFLPCDLPSYNLALLPRPLQNRQGHISVDAAQNLHSIFGAVLGTDQSDFAPETRISGPTCDEPPFLAMSSWYTDFVRSGLIKVHRGKLFKLDGTTATFSSGNGDQYIQNVAAVILATGFDPTPSLSFLPPSVLETLSHSPSNPNLPLALAFHGTHHPSLPTLGFVGFYRSPYWGIMEMQARFLCQLWTAQPDERNGRMRAALDRDDSIARALALRTDPRCSQFPMGDYAYLMDVFANALGLDLAPVPMVSAAGDNGHGMDILTPARYVSPGASEAQHRHARHNLENTRATAFAGLRGGRFVAGAVFRSLLGEWRLERELVSRRPDHPSGHFSGTARFLLRRGTADGRAKTTMANDDGGDPGLEYLYIEDGDFTAAAGPGSGMRFRATRRYVWRYDEARDALSVWFARTDDHARADYLFHELEFFAADGVGLGEGGGQTEPARARADGTRPGGRTGGRGGWRAKASHLCVEDLYDVHYEFGFKAVNLAEWRLGYTVKGPKKDYTIDGVYRRL